MKSRSHSRRKKLVASRVALLGCGVALALSACGGEDTGAVHVTTWGEEFIEEGLPPEAFEDGYAVQFESFLVGLGRVRASGSAGSFEDDRTWLVDLVEPGPHELFSLSVPSGQWEHFEYSVVPVDAETVLHASATEQDRASMVDGGFSVAVSGVAQRDELVHRFDWRFDSRTTYADCVQDIDGRQRPGFNLGAGGRTELELTIHGDHFFYDDLASGEAVLRFEAIAAADADDDGDVTLDELSATSLLDLPLGSYGTGNVSDVNDLGAFVRALVTGLGHFNGEGHCNPR